jgi:LEA14-like dessication related protein
MPSWLPSWMTPFVNRAVLRRAIFGAVFLAVFGLVSCTYLRDLVGLGPTRPKVELLRFEVSRLSWGSVDLMATLRVDNPNRFELSMSRLTYTVETGGDIFARGNWSGEFRVAAQSSAELRLPLSITPGRVVDLLARMLQSEAGEKALIKADGDFSSALGSITLTFEEEKLLPRLNSQP